ncbi:MAG: DUF222 domain-containing protein [Arachnia sp.]
MHQTRVLSTGEAIDRMAALLDRVNVAEWEHLPEPELVGVLLSARRLVDRVTGLTAGLTRVVDLRNAAMAGTGMPLHSLITIRENRDGKDAARGLGLGRDIARNPQVARGVIEGTLTPDHAQKLTKALDDLPSGLRREQCEQITDLLIEEAAQCRPSELPAKARTLLERVAPELVPSDGDEERRVAAQRRAALRRRSLRFGDDGEGSFWVRGSLPYLEAQPLLGTLDKMVAAQKRAEQDHGGPSRLHHAAAGMPSREQRYADALVDLAAAAAGNLGTTEGPNGASPGGRSVSPEPAGGAPVPTAGPAAREAEAPRLGAGPSSRTIPPIPATVVVTVAEADLRERATATGLLPSGHRIPAGELRRLLCDANIIPVVLGSRSEILDMGRATRFVTPPQRRALAMRDKHCIFPGCTVSEPECHAHHVVPWWRGGTSDLDNLVLLCPHHHGLVEPTRLHDDKTTTRWDVVFDPVTGTPTVRPAVRDLATGRQTARAVAAGEQAAHDRAAEPPRWQTPVLAPPPTDGYIDTG